MMLLNSGAIGKPARTASSVNGRTGKHHKAALRALPAIPFFKNSCKESAFSGLRIPASSIQSVKLSNTDLASLAVTPAVPFLRNVGLRNTNPERCSKALVPGGGGLPPSMT